MTYHIVFLDRASVPAHITVREPHFAHTWKNYESTTADEIIQRAQGANIIVTNKVVLTEEHLSQLPQLQHIAVIATGYNNIDIVYCQQNGISVSNIRGYAVKAVPEHVLALILALRRHLFNYQYSMQKGEWQHSAFFHHYLKPTLELADSQLGIIGGGELGQATANLGQALGMKVVFADRKGTQASGRKDYATFEQVIKDSDVISIHCPLTKETKDLITLKEMEIMKPTALLINTARGGLVNESDLVTAIKNQLIGGAGFDVASVEPIQEDNPLLSILDQPNFILTPHVAWTTDSAMQTQADQLIKNIEAFADGHPQNLVC